MKDDPRARKTCRLFLDEALWCDGGINATASQERSETCLTGMVLGLLDRPSPEEAHTRRSLAAPEQASRQDVLRVGDRRDAEPLEYAESAQGSQVVRARQGGRPTMECT